MVTSPARIYVFAGEDLKAKTDQLNALKEEFLPENTREFNLDMLYAKELALQDLQERLLCIPVHSAQRIVAIRNSEALSADVKKFLCEYASDAENTVLLVLDFARFDPKDAFQADLCRKGRLIRFKEEARPDTFALGRQINSGRAEAALTLLHVLLEEGEKPERILGGLRYSCQRGDAKSARLVYKEILRCDRDIKTGRLRPVFALERLVLNLSGFNNSFRQA